MNYREQKRQKEMARQEMWRYDARNRIKDTRRGKALAQARIDNLICQGLQSIFTPPDLRCKSEKAALVLGLFFGLFALPFYLRSFGTLIVGSSFWFLGTIGGSLLATPFLSAREHALAFVALIIGWSVPAIIAAVHIKIKKL